MRLELYTIDQKLPRLIIYLLLGNNWTTYKGELNTQRVPRKYFKNCKKVLETDLRFSYYI